MTESRTFPPKFDVLGTGISMTSYDEVIKTFRTPRTDRATVVAVCNVHSVMSARRDPQLRQALDSADIATPDGMPLVWAIRSGGLREQQRVYGPALMRRTLVEKPELRHFLYGGSPGVLELLQDRIRRISPSVQLVGAISPPYRQIDETELDGHTKSMRNSGADVVWVGLGMPKQELWMATVAERLPGMTIVGVGAAFDFLAGTVAQAPQWIQALGFEWLFRLVQEPRRLWRRYILNNPEFLVLWALQRLRSRSRSSRLVLIRFFLRVSK